MHNCHDISPGGTSFVCFICENWICQAHSEMMDDEYDLPDEVYCKPCKTNEVKKYLLHKN